MISVETFHETHDITAITCSAIISVCILKRHICKQCKLLPFGLSLTAFQQAFCKLVDYNRSIQTSPCIVNSSLVLNLTLIPITLCREIMCLSQKRTLLHAQAFYYLILTDIKQSQFSSTTV